MKKDIVLAILIASLLMGCGGLPASKYATAGMGAPPADGNVIAMGIAETLKYMNMVIQDTPGTFIYGGPNGNYLFSWSISANKYGFLGFNSKLGPVDFMKDFCGSQYANCLTFSSLVKTLEENGWQRIFAKDLPQWIITLFSSAVVFLDTYGSIFISHPAIMIVPGTGGFVDPFPTAIN